MDGLWNEVDRLELNGTRRKGDPAACKMGGGWVGEGKEELVDV